MSKRSGLSKPEAFNSKTLSPVDCPRKTQCTSYPAVQGKRPLRLPSLTVPARLGVPPPRGRLPAEQPGRRVLPRTDDSSPPQEKRGDSTPRPRALARRPRPRPAISCPLAGDRACVGVAPLGKVKGLPATFPPRAASFRHRPESNRARRPAGRVVQQETAPAQAAGSGGARRPAGWLCQSQRAGAAAHVSQRHVRARPRGLRQLPLLKRVGRDCAQPSAAGGGQSARPRAPRASATPGARGEDQRGPVPALPVPVGSALPPPPSSPDWAPWRCPGVRHPRGAHRLDPGGPAAGRRPQVHGGLGAR